MHTLLKHTVKGQSLCLSADRSIFWEEQKALIVSDLHFGKTGHFRKSGIAVPQNVYKEDIQRLLNLIQFFKPRQLIVVGDFFHSHANKELDLFLKWRADLEHLHIILVKGNHDILKPEWYNQANISIADDCLTIGPFTFVHDLESCNPDKDQYIFSGHIHPGIYLAGTGRQSLRLPCFYFTSNYAVLPAFSRFTGLAIIEPQPHETVFALADKTIIPFYGRHASAENCL
ncbi:MAG TPA: ligase-associated DNA damage response endonuclease PdeM [Chitinophagaceae bacterium]|nr:ligase-associated DNA damage response endonuclease PdeM [Chitinophagaceae bacterium]